MLVYQRVKKKNIRRSARSLHFLLKPQSIPVPQRPPLRLQALLQVAGDEFFQTSLPGHDETQLVSYLEDDFWMEMLSEIISDFGVQFFANPQYITV